MTPWHWSATSPDGLLSGVRWHTGHWSDLADQIATEIRIAFGRDAGGHVQVWPVEVPPVNVDNPRPAASRGGAR